MIRSHYSRANRPEHWDHALRRVLSARVALRQRHALAPTRKGRASIRRRIGVLSRRFLTLCRAARKARKVAEAVLSN